MFHTTRARGHAPFLFLLLLALSRSELLAAGLTSSQPVAAVGGLLERLIPSRADRFVLETIPRQNGKDVFEIETRDGKVLVAQVPPAWPSPRAPAGT